MATENRGRRETMWPMFCGYTSRSAGVLVPYSWRTAVHFLPCISGIHQTRVKCPSGCYKHCASDMNTRRMWISCKDIQFSDVSLRITRAVYLKLNKLTLELATLAPCRWHFIYAQERFRFILNYDWRHQDNACIDCQVLYIVISVIISYLTWLYKCQH